MTERLDTFTGKPSAKTSSAPPTGHPLPLASSRQGWGKGRHCQTCLVPHPLWSWAVPLPSLGLRPLGGRKGRKVVRQIPWHVSDTGKAQQGAAPIQMGLQGFSGLSLRLRGWSWTRALTVVTADLRGIPPATLPLRPTPPSLQGREVTPGGQHASTSSLYTALYNIQKPLYTDIFIE